MVARNTFNPTLKGVLVRNVKVCRRVNKTGRPQSVPAPPGYALTRSCPELAFIDPDRYDRVVVALRAKNAEYARGRLRKAAADRKGVPRKSTVWPSQHLGCRVCGRPYYWGGHGVKEHMICSGARDYRCWNAATCDGQDAGRRLTAAILAEVERLPEFDEVFAAKVRERIAARRSTRDADLARLARLARRLGRVDESIRAG